MSMIGKTLRNFQCTALLGKGGMGEVYRAKDQKLGRDVAIKVLPEEFAKDTDRVARFQREAKLLASLNHPNIAAIHGLEESDGIHFLVLELIEGDTLADRIKGGPIPVEEALKLALQIAEALEAAHEKGVIHRDLKPANIKVTPDGKVKVLDFGLAKAFAGDQAEVNLSHSPTLSDMATQQGVILGTAAYMSPEQAKGKALDKRTDIWAFGCILYEMLTGRQTWTGDTVTDIIAAAVAKDPDFSILPANIHPSLPLLLRQCLQKDPTERFRDVGDIRIQMKQIQADPSGVFAQPVAAVEPRKKLQTMLLWAASLVLIAIVAGMAVWNLRTPEPKQVTSFEYELPEGQGFGIMGLQNCVFAISPDGSKFVYATQQGLYLRSMAELSARPIVGSEENAQNPFFSPDGQWIGYVSGGGKLKKVSVNGGAPISIADVADLRGHLNWCENGTIVYAPDLGANIMRISGNGGDPELLVKGNGQMLLAPQILPDGKTVMFTTSPEPFKIMLHSLETGEEKELMEGNTAQYLPTGHIVYANENNLFAVPFDLDRLETIGGPISMIEGVLQSGGAPQYAVSESGTLVYIPGRMIAALPNIPQFTLVWVDLQGREEPIDVGPGFYLQPKISPDGTKVALTVITEEGSSDIWIWDFIRKNLTRLTRNGNSTNPLWTLDGQRIVFVSGDENKSGIYWRAANGTGKDELMGSVPDWMLVPNSWSKDGKTLITTKQLRLPQALRQSMMSGVRGRGVGAGGRGGGDRGGRAGPLQMSRNSDIGLLSMESDHEWKPLLKEEYWELDPQISPDGRWIAYMSTESEQAEIYLRPFPDVDKSKTKVSTDGGNRPQWSPDGRELFYDGPDGLMAVTVETDPVVKLGTPKRLFQGRYAGLDLSPDGKRFLAIKRPQATTGEAPRETSAQEMPRKINIVVNWFEELKERVPVE